MKNKKILFLRKFGFYIGSRKLISLIHKSICSGYRFIALDDEAFETVHVPKPIEIASFVAMFGCLFFLMIFYWFATSLVIGYWGGFIGTTLKWHQIYYYVEPLIILVGTISVFWVIVGTNFIMYRTYRKLGKIKIIRSWNICHIMNAAIKIFSNSIALSLALPRSIAFEIEGKHWKDAVGHLICKCELAIVDISDCTKNIEWEIALLKKTDRCKAIFVGEDKKLRSWLKISLESEDRNELISQLKGKTIILYRSDEQDNKHVINLQNAIDNEIV